MFGSQGRFLLLLAVGIGVCLAGCAPRPSPTPTPRLNPSATPFILAPLALETPDLAVGAALTYHRKGGLVGYCDLMAVSPTGLVTYIADCRQINQTQQLAPEQLAQLQQLLGGIGRFDVALDDDPNRPRNLRRELSFQGYGPEATPAQQEQVWAFAEQLMAEFGFTSATTPVATPQRVVLYGQVEDLLTRVPVANAYVVAGYNGTPTDADGKFRLLSFEDDPILVQAPEYELGNSRADTARPLIVKLVPNPRATLAHVYRYLRDRQYAEAYYVLHPDVQALFTRDSFIAFKERTINYQIADVTLGSITWLPTWLWEGRTYTNVAQVPAYRVLRRGDQQWTETVYEHLAYADGFWRWFHPPLAAATPPAPPTATGCTTPIYPIGTVVEVWGTSVLNMRSGPGTNYPVVNTMLFGERLIIRGAPTCVGDPSWWYQVEQIDTGEIGWVIEHYIRPVGGVQPGTPVPGATLTPVPGVTLTPVPGVPPGSLSPGARVSATSNLALHTAPGEGAPVISTVARGADLTIRSEMFFKDGIPWYVVDPGGRGLAGWANGLYLTPAAAGAAAAAPAPAPVPAPSATPVFFPPLTAIVPPLLRTAIPGAATAFVPRLETAVIPSLATAIVPPRQTAVVRTPATAPPPGGVVAAGAGYPVGTLVVVSSSGPVNLTAGAGVGTAVMGTANPGSTLIVRSGPTVVNNIPWYLVEDRSTSVVGWVPGTSIQEVAPGSDYYNLQWAASCTPPRLEVALLRAGQSACDPGVLTRPLSWLVVELGRVGLLASGERLEVTSTAECAACGIVVKNSAGADVGWLRIGDGPPGAVWRTTFPSPPIPVGLRCLLRQNEQWECR